MGMSTVMNETHGGTGITGEMWRCN